MLRTQRGSIRQAECLGYFYEQGNISTAFFVFEPFAGIYPRNYNSHLLDKLELAYFLRNPIAKIAHTTIPITKGMAYRNAVLAGAL